MRTLRITKIACSKCSAEQLPTVFLPTCPACHKDNFRISIEKKSLGLDPGEIGEPLIWAFLGGDIGLALYMVKEGFGSPIHASKETVEIEGMTGREVRSLIRSTLEEALNQIVALKRRIAESRLDERSKICNRCGIVFKHYDNDWHQAGFCSKRCQEYESKTRWKRAADNAE
jgi:hypothetical protein